MSEGIRARSPLFEGLDSAALEDICRHMTPRRFGAREVICRLEAGAASELARALPESRQHSVKISGGAVARPGQEKAPRPSDRGAFCFGAP